MPHGLEPPSGGNVQAPALSESEMDLVKQAILERSPQQSMFSATDLYDMLRSKKHPVFKANLTESIKKAGSYLVDMAAISSGEAIRRRCRRFKKKRRPSNETTPGYQDWQFTKRAEKIYKGVHSGKTPQLFHKCQVGALEVDDTKATERACLRVALTCFPKTVRQNSRLVNGVPVDLLCCSRMTSACVTSCVLFSLLGSRLPHTQAGETFLPPN